MVEEHGLIGHVCLPKPPQVRGCMHVGAPPVMGSGREGIERMKVSGGPMHGVTVSYRKARLLRYLSRLSSFLP